VGGAIGFLSDKATPRWCCH